MFVCIFIFILILPITFLSVALEDFFAPEELDAMGIAYHKHSTA